MVQKATATYRKILEEELDLRRQKNPSYSLRAFSRDIAMPAPKLSQVLSGKCGISEKTAERIAMLLKLSPQERNYFVNLVAVEHSRSRVGKELAKKRLENAEADGYGELSLERFKIISDWYYFAILGLTETVGFQKNHKWIAKQLGITASQAKTAIQLLLDHGLLEEAKTGSLKQSRSNLATPSEIPSQCIRKHHTQILGKAIEALENVSVANRDFSSTTFAINKDDLPRAKAELRKFRRKFSLSLQKSDKKDEVYCLSVQFFPVSRNAYSKESNK